MIDDHILPKIAGARSARDEASVTAVRILGIVAGIGLFLMAVRAYERRRISRFNLIVVTLLGTALVVLSLRPSVYDPVFNWFDIVPGAERR